VTLKFVVTIVKYLLGSLLLVGFHIVILCSLKHLKKSAFCISMSMNQTNDVHYSVITGILVITIHKSMNKKTTHCSLDTSVSIGCSFRC